MNNKLITKLTGLAFILALALPVAGISAQSSSSNGLAIDAEHVTPLLPGMKAPQFEIRDVTGKLISVDPEKLEKPVILTFFRGGWCPYCNMHLAELRHAEKELLAMGFDVWFLSTDKPEILYESLKEPDIKYTIYSDARLDAAKKFGVAFQVDKDTIQRYQGFGIDLKAASGEQHQALPAPATFLIGTDGIINFMYTNPDYKVRLHPDVLVAVAKVYKDGTDKRLLKKR